MNCVLALQFITKTPLSCKQCYKSKSKEWRASGHQEGRIGRKSPLKIVGHVSVVVMPFKNEGTYTELELSIGMGVWTIIFLLLPVIEIQFIYQISPL